VVPPPEGARGIVVGGSAWHVVAADVDPEWVAEAVAHDPIAAAFVPDGEPLWARVATVNTASLRAFLAAGYRPVCAEVLFGP
jgi:hypothetical protein